MKKYLADEDLKGQILRGVKRQKPDLEIVRVVDVGLSGADDDTILQWTADHDCILVTHDRRTIPKRVFDRLSRGEHTPGVLIVDDRSSIARCVEVLLIIAECATPNDVRDLVRYIPLQ